MNTNLKNILTAIKLFNAPYLNEFALQIESGADAMKADLEARIAVLRYNRNAEIPANSGAIEYSNNCGSFRLLWQSRSGNIYRFCYSEHCAIIECPENSSFADSFKAINEAISKGEIAKVKDNRFSHVTYKGGRRKK